MAAIVNAMEAICLWGGEKKNVSESKWSERKFFLTACDALWRQGCRPVMAKRGRGMWGRVCPYV